MSSLNLANELLGALGGVSKNSLNSLLEIDNKNGDQYETFTSSDYYDIDSFIKLFKSLEQIFSSISLNMESLPSKFNQLLAFLEILNENGCMLDAMLLQETWLSDKQCSKKAIQIYDIPGYNTIPLGRKCGRKGGLIIYLRDIYTFKRRKLYTNSLHWEGIFIDVTHKNDIPLPNKITISNIYRPPRKNYSNPSIKLFLDPFTEIFNTLSKEHSTLITGGDFNLNLLEVTHREKFQEYLDLFLANGSIPQITLPTRFSRRKATLIDQIYCRFTKMSSHNSSGVIVTKISDHLPCFSFINFSSNSNKKPKYIKIQARGPEAINSFKTEVKNGISATEFDSALLSDPNFNYNKLEHIITEARSKAFPIKEVKFNQKKHRLKPWITFDLLKSIKVRDCLYTKWKKTNPVSPNYKTRESDFKEYRSIVQKNIREAKSEYYQKSFENYKTDMKKTWNKINEILSNKKRKD